MRRSAAPSQIGHVTKKPRFQPPVSSNPTIKDGEQLEEVVNPTLKNVRSVINKHPKKKKSTRPFVSPIIKLESRDDSFQPKESTAALHRDVHSSQDNSDSGIDKVPSKLEISALSKLRDSKSNSDSPCNSPKTKNNYEIASQKKLNFNVFKIPSTSLTSVSGSSTGTGNIATAAIKVEPGSCNKEAESTGIKSIGSGSDTGTEDARGRRSDRIVNGDTHSGKGGRAHQGSVRLNFSAFKIPSASLTSVSTKSDTSPIKLENGNDSDAEENSECGSNDRTGNTETTGSGSDESDIVKGGLAHRCDVCSKQFKLKSGLDRHMVTHSGEKHFACPFCERRFTQKSNLDVHIRTHTGEKPHQCKLCDRRFTQLSGLNQHILWHKGEKPFKCQLCDKAFTQKSGLEVHMYSHWGQKPHVCQFCDKQFAARIPLTQHLLAMHGHEESSPKSVPSLGAQHENSSEPTTKYFSVMWCKLSKKKHKTWEGDAILVAKGKSLRLLDMEGKEIGRGSGYKASELANLTDGNTLCIGSKEIEVMGSLSEAAFKTGQCFNSSSATTPSPATVRPSAPSKPFVKPTKVGESSASVPTGTHAVKPRYDPAAPNALVLPRPTQSQLWECTKKGGSVIDVVVDPYLSQHLRPHQRTGVVFLYKCVMGMKDYGGQGAILADEMGLGKTLQCIALVWTLLKQGPFNGKPVARKVLIITPGSLVKNWMREFKKWLGTERLKVYAVSQDTKVEDFIYLAHHPVLIISYEMFVRTFEIVKKINFDLIVCDEGHRLKNTSIKTTALVQSLAVRRRIVLTGTPVQNDLQELYSIVNFCNPTVLGSQASFRRVYEEPILASRQPGACEDVQAIGRERATELNRITSMFILRRTSDINNKYLPPKVELVLFCQPSNLQRQLYRQLIASPTLRSCLASSDPGQHLMCISALKKLCNHPVLLHESAVKAGAEDESGFNTQCDLYKDLLTHYPMTFDLDRPISADSGKLSVVENMLHELHSCDPPREKIVLVSNYTQVCYVDLFMWQTLNILSTLCRCKGYAFLRLDGQTPTSKRQQIVERFNSSYSPELVFLLSSKAGGVGLNLIGASRLVLYDIDWNPANDLQAMARVWRDGQRKTVYIYRLLTTGSIEEKMFQRQISKQSLSGVIVDAKTSNNKLSFSAEELRDLFTLQEHTACATHSLLDCQCIEQSKNEVKPVTSQTSGTRKCQLGLSASKSKKNLCMDELLEWRHVTGPKPDLSSVDPLLGADSLGTVSFAFYNECNKQPIANESLS